MRLSDISDTKTLRAGFPDICRAIKEKETDMEVTEKNRTKYRMPGEFEPHEGCVMIWPERPGSWNYGAREAQKAFVKVAEAIGESEKVYMLVSKAQMENAKNQLGNVSGVILLECETDDAWARDVGATMVLDEKGAVCGVDWQFNAWGGDFDGLYRNWEKDDRVAAFICRTLGCPCLDARPFVLEGGSIHSHGEGTLIVTEACLLSQGRNPQMSREQIEEQLKYWLGVHKIIWLPCGIYQDETNEHVDNVCAFVRPGEVVLAWTEDETDPQYAMSLADLKVLEQETDAKGRKFKIHKLPIPQKPVCLTQEDVDGFVFEEGEDEREAGERMAASYVNFYISNGGIILPQFGDENDKRAVEILQKCFPERRIQGLEISSQFHFKRIKVIIMLFLEIHDFTHNNPRRENGGITARHDRISFLKLHVARQLVQIGKTCITPVPAQRSEITTPQHLAAQFELRIQQRDYNGKMVGNRRHNSHDTPFRHNSHVRLHSILTAFIHRNIIG